MSKLLLVCARQSSYFFPELEQKISSVCRNILPGIIIPNPTQIIRSEKLVIGIANPVETIEFNEHAICLGNLSEENRDWWKINASLPNGSYSLYRFNTNHIEIATDNVGSRHIWYYQDENLFIASSSQRAIIQYLGSFVPNPAAYSWMLSVGSLVQGLSWDKRIKPLPINSRLIFDRNTWESEMTQFPIDYELPVKKKKEYEEEYLNVLTKHLKSQEFDSSNWVLPLSGGYDSRSLLLFLGNGMKLNSVTWGDQASEKNEFTDVGIAKKIAKHFQLSHQFIPIKKGQESLEVIIERFIRYSEGLTDHFAGYLDGFELWKTLFELNYSGYIRGDRAMWTRPPRGLDDVVYQLGIAPLGFYSNGQYLESQLEKQELPEYLQQKEGESLTHWKNRLIHQHHVPCVLGSLIECKSGFLEMANPLLNNPHANYSLSLTEKTRTVHEVFKELVIKEGPKIPVASQNSNVALKDIVRSKDLVELMQKEFLKEDSQNVFPEEVLNYLLTSLKTNDTALSDLTPRKESKLKAFLKSRIPKPIRKRRALNKGYELDMNRVALRALITIRAVRMLEKDATRYQPVKQ